MSDTQNQNSSTPLERNVMWLAGWYATRLHAYTGLPLGGSTKSVQALCGAFVTEIPQTEWAAKKLKNGIAHCKRCEKLLASDTITLGAKS